MGITFEQVKKHLDHKRSWQNFESCTFEPRLLTIKETLGYLSAWSFGKMTVREHLRRHMRGDLAKGEEVPDMDRIKEYAANFLPGLIVLVGFTLGTLGRIWSKNFPNATGDDIVLWDGHHRATALAIREMNGEQDDNPIVMFVGQ